MGALVRTFDWGATSLGPSACWPQSLRTVVRLVLNSRQPMFIWYGPELIQLYNDAYRLTLGPERHPGALGQPGRDCWAEIWGIIGPQIEFVMAGGDATWHADQLVPMTRHGRCEDAWWTYGFSPIDDDTQPAGVGGILVVCNDVTAEHLARGTRLASEEKLRIALGATQERLRHALDAAAVGTWDWDVSSDLIFGDANLARIFDFDRRLAFPGLPSGVYLGAIHPDDRQRVEAAIRLTIATGETYEEEHRLLRADGSVRWIVARGGCLHNANGAALRFTGAAVDISERRAAEAALRAGETRWQAVFENMHEGFALGEMIHDGSGKAMDYRYLEVNAAFERLTGIPRAKAIGHTVREIVPGVEAGWIETCARVVATGKPEHTLRWAASRRSWHEITVYPVHPGRFAALFMDVTERRAAEERQALLSREVDHRAKNALAVVQAVLRLTTAGDVPGFVRVVEGRIGALTRAQTLLADEGWSGVDLRALLQGELAPFLGSAGLGTAGVGPVAVLDGPPVALPAGSAQPLAMALHELATNAVKYGALSNPAGRVAVSWYLEPQPGLAAIPLLRLRWAEAGGPPVAGPPGRRGFGSRVLDATLRRQLGGGMSQVWEASGLICQIEVPLRPPPEPATAPGYGLIAAD